MSKYRYNRIFKNGKCIDEHRYIIFDKLKSDKICSECNSINDICIHHIDNNPKNNDIKNLQILCRSCHTLFHNTIGIKEQTKEKISKSMKKYWSESNRKRKEGLCLKRVVQLSLSGEKIKEYNGATEASKYGFNRHLIGMCCRGLNKTHKGFRWEFI